LRVPKRFDFVKFLHLIRHKPIAKLNCFYSEIEVVLVSL